jgi:hypothetical protein
MLREPRIAALIALSMNLGCGGSPIAPRLPLQIQQSTPQPAPPVIPEQPSAVVVIEQASVEEYPPKPDLDRNGRPVQDYYAYVVRFLLRETSGNSHAQIEEVVVHDGRGDGNSTGQSCWIQSLSVPPGGTLDVFYTDEGLRWLGYCGPFTGSKTPLASVRVSVQFEANNNREGIVEVDIPVGPPGH